MSEKEKIIIEQRTIEATRKGLMGLSGKIGVIICNLGDPILSHSSGVEWANSIGYTSREYDNYWYDLETENEFPTMDVKDDLGNSLIEPNSPEWNQNKSNRTNAYIHNLGFHFDGLNRGYHLEMKYLEEECEITVHYKGYLVFKENSGKLLAYTPMEEWESKIDRLFISAKKIQENKKKHDKEQTLEEAKKKKQSFIERLRTTWGI